MGLLQIFNFLFNKRLVHQDKNKRVIHNQEKISFKSYSSWHLIVITASAKGEKQLGEDATDDEDLIVKIDNKIFPKLNSSDLKDSPASFSGGTLHDSAKTIYFLTFLYGTEHTITLRTEDPTNTATLKSLEVYRIQELKKKFTIRPYVQSKDRDRSPWLVFVLDNLPLQYLKTRITYFKRKYDSDDVKVIIDGKIQTSHLSGIKHFFWKISGSRLSWEFPIKTKTERFLPLLPKGLHYIEFYADRMPIMHKLAINFGKKPPIPELLIPEPPIPLMTMDLEAKSEKEKKKSPKTRTPEFIIERVNELYREVGSEVRFDKIPMPLKGFTRYDEEIEIASKEFNIDPIILKATIAQESSFGEKVDHDVRYIGESGLMGLEKLKSISKLKDLGYDFDYNDIGDVVRASAAYYNWVRERPTKFVFEDKNNPLKLYTQYRIDLSAEKIDTAGIPQFLYYYFYYKQ